MGIRLLRYQLPLIFSSIFILLLRQFNGDSLDWRFLIIPVTILIIVRSRKSNYHNFVSGITATIAGITVFVSFPTTMSFIVLTLMAFKFNDNYQPISIQPRLLKDRNISPFLLMSLAITRLIPDLLNVQFLFATDLEKNSSFEIFFFTLAFIGFLESLIILTQKSYDPIKSKIATKDKDWTNNVMTLLSHNIRTPIASMGNRVDIIKLKKSAGIEISDDDIQALGEDRERVNSIVHGLLSKSSRSIISSKNASKSSINEALNIYINRVKILKPEDIDFNLSSNDKIALDLALEAVISNSEKYGASLIQISMTSGDEEILIQISDDGEGMDDETLERYGTPFNSKKSRKGGTGLGVYFALQLIKEAGWHWSVESELGKGTSVTINIPKQLLVF